MRVVVLESLHSNRAASTSVCIGSVKAELRFVNKRNLSYPPGDTVRDRTTMETVAKQTPPLIPLPNHFAHHPCAEHLPVSIEYYKVCMSPCPKGAFLVLDA